ncbi:MAG: phosphotransferase KptA/Tpt1, partial [Olpidium bornovanus]
FAVKSLKGFTLEDVRECVETNDKQRFQLREDDGVLLIKANQGHSIAVSDSRTQIATTSVFCVLVSGPATSERGNKCSRLWLSGARGSQVNELDLAKIIDPAEIPVVIHGTDAKLWDSIVKNGLSRMGRNHIHFAVGRLGENGVTSGA